MGEQPHRHEVEGVGDGGLVLENGTLLEPMREPVSDAAVWICAGRVAYAGPRSGLPRRPAGAQRVDVRGGFIAPGFVDLHVHGGGGADTMEASMEGLRRMSLAHAACGTTTLLCTTVTASEPQLTAAIRAARSAASAAAEALAQAVPGEGGGEAAGIWGARIVGVHLEGPYLNPERKGAQNPAYMRDPSLAELARLVEAGGSPPAEFEGRPFVRLMTLAPERRGALEAVRWLRQAGVAVALGHSAADETTVREAIEAGASQVTHLFNGMPPFHHRSPGLSGVALADDRLVVQLIPDGVHVHPTALRVAFRARGPCGIALITDALAPMGLGEGRFRLGDFEVEVRDGACRLEDGTLAGSILGLGDGVRNMVRWAGATVAEAVTMASRVPAACLGVSEKLGTLRAGAMGDAVVLEPDDCRVVLTVLGGRIVFRRGL